MDNLHSRLYQIIRDRQSNNITEMEIKDLPQYD